MRKALPAAKLHFEVEVAGHARGEGGVVGGVVGDPLFVGHGGAPLEEGKGVWAYGMAELGGVVASDVQDFLRDHGWRDGIRQGCRK